MTLVRNGGNHDSAGRAGEGLLRGDDRRAASTSEGQSFTQEMRKARAARARSVTWDPTLSRQDLDEAVGAAHRLRELCGGGIRFGGGLSRHGRHAGRRTAARARGVDRDRQAGRADRARQSLPAAQFSGKVTAYLATFSTVPPSEIAAARAVFGEIDIHGKLPVTIPGQAQYGEGIQLQATRALKTSSATPVAVQSGDAIQSSAARRGMVLLALVIAAAVYDSRYRRIPNWLTLAGVLTGLGLNTFLFPVCPGCCTL